MYIYGSQYICLRNSKCRYMRLLESKRVVYSWWENINQAKTVAQRYNIFWVDSFGYWQQYIDNINKLITLEDLNPLSLIYAEEKNYESVGKYYNQYHRKIIFDSTIYVNCGVIFNILQFAGLVLHLLLLTKTKHFPDRAWNINLIIEESRTHIISFLPTFPIFTTKGQKRF